MLKKTCDYTDAFHEDPKHTDRPFSNPKDNSRWQRVEHTYFPTFCQLAKTCYGYTELSICEQTNTADLLFRAEEFTLNGTPSPERTAFLEIIADADDLYLTGSEASFELHLLFRLS